MYSAVPEGYNSIGMYLHDVHPSCSYLSRLMTKQTKWHVRPAKPQISLGIRPVWSEYSLSARRKLGSLATHWALSEDWSNWAVAQADLSLRWAHSHFVGFVVRWLILGYVVTENFRMSERAYEVYKSQITAGLTCRTALFSNCFSFNQSCYRFYFSNEYNYFTKSNILRVSKIIIIINNDCSY